MSDKAFLLRIALYLLAVAALAAIVFIFYM